MTYPRHFLRLALSCAFFFAVFTIPSVKANIGLTSLVAISLWNGVAIDGYDPVTYFTDKKPRPGHADLEVVWKDAVWRFANEGNRAAFEAHPEIYAPRFGGFDPLGVTEGLLIKGDVGIFAMGADKKLYLFRDTRSRDAFLSDGGLMAKADITWEEMVIRVVP